MCTSTDRTELIVKVIKETAAYKSGGINYRRKRKSVLVYDPQGKDFLAISLFNALGIFKIVIKADPYGRVYLKIK
ncbi:hypothetical protein [Aquimarina algiphila]|uniref:hypothetical protein n=1 Tax=Aquimarina algiphila TaxID=2047982 RepID=UPI00232C8001|nr:hypothetical protein [Aquimarina algiphila]